MISPLFFNAMQSTVTTFRVFLTRGICLEKVSSKLRFSTFEFSRQTRGAICKILTAKFCTNPEKLCPQRIYWFFLILFVSGLDFHRFILHFSSLHCKN